MINELSSMWKEVI